MTPDVTPDSQQTGYQRPSRWTRLGDTAGDTPIWPTVTTLRADLAAAQADAAAWRSRYAELRAIVLLVEDFSDAQDVTTAQSLLDAFRAFRKLVEGDTPRAWGVAPVIDDWAAGAGDAVEDVPW